MATRFVSTSLAAATLLLAPLSIAHAQHRRHRPLEPWEMHSGPRISVGADGVFSAVRARAIDSRIGDGVGFDAHGSLDVSALSIGGGYQRTRHELSGSNDRATYSGWYAEPRVALDLGAGNFTPYLSARLGRTRVELPPTFVGTAAGRLTGTNYGAGGGVGVWLAQSVSLDLGAMWSRLDLGSRRTSALDVLHNAEDGLMLHAGLRLTM